MATQTSRVISMPARAKALNLPASSLRRLHQRADGGWGGVSPRMSQKKRQAARRLPG